MKKYTIKLLAVAPSESIQNLIYEIAEAKEGLEIDVFVGNLYSGVEIVHQKLNSTYDAILSRGETAAMIKKIVDIPVIEIPLSFYDILHAMKLADNFHEPYAIIGFTPVTNCAHLLRELLQLNLDIYTLFKLDDAVPIMEDLKNKGYHLIVSGMGIDSIARRNGLNSILITTGRDSIDSAINHAIQVCSIFVRIKEEKTFLNHLLEESNDEIIVYNEKKEKVFSTLKSLNEESAGSITAKEFRDPHSTSASITRTKDGMLISAQKKPLLINGAAYTAFYFRQQKAPYISSKNEIRSFSYDEAIDIFLLHYLELSSSGYVSAYSLSQIASAAYPVMLFGENGVGKEQAAAMLYTQGKYQNHPYLLIDFELLTDKSWSFLTSNDNSPINSDGLTLYFRHLEKLNLFRIDKLRTILSDTGVCRRSRVILSYTTVPGEKVPGHVMALVNQLGCNVVRITPLRERVDEIQALSSLYISTLNLDLAKQVIGFTPHAETLIKQYQWPGNLTQFKRVITQLVICSASPYIQEELVQKTLDTENANLTSASALSSILNLDKTLNEIERDVVKAVLAESGGNQSQAAIKLGICRTTLWRIINK